MRFFLEIVMKKLVLLTGLLAAISGTSVFAQATPVTSSFDVTVNLQSRCRIATGAGTVIDFGQYTAFGAATNAAPSINITLQCTRGFGTPSLSFDTATDASSSAPSIAPTGVGVIAGLQYSLAVTGGTAATPGDAASTTALGTADRRIFAVTGTMPAGQPGACATASCIGTQNRTLTISY
jgi:spore coat protein U-like protein